MILSLPGYNCYLNPLHVTVGYINLLSQMKKDAYKITNSVVSGIAVSFMAMLPKHLTHVNVTQAEHQSGELNSAENVTGSIPAGNVCSLADTCQ